LILADTSAFQALASREDPRHAEEAALLDSIRRGSEDLPVHTCVLAETFALLHRRFGRDLALRTSDDIAGVRTIVVDRELHDRGAEWLRSRRESRLSLVDAVSFVVMRENGMDTAFAFDPDFEKAGFRLYGGP
jgi:predicted nucleic acid-binding protein